MCIRDSGSIVYSAMWDGGERQLYIARTDDPGARELGLKDAELLSISKGGELAVRLKTVVYSGYAQTGTLARLPLSGGTPREVLENVQDADWAADGGSLAVVDVYKRQGDAVVVEAAAVGVFLAALEGAFYLDAEEVAMVVYY